MTRLIGCIFLFMTLTSQWVPAQTAGAPKGQVIFAVDASRSMSRVSAMSRQVVFDLVYDGVQGQMSSGDLYSIWVFNEKVYTNDFASMTWDPLLNRGLAIGASNFVKSLSYGKNTKLDRLWADLVAYARQTRKLTVIIITDGTDRFVGTTFDTQLNTFFDKHEKEYHEAKKPFVITLAALDGKFLACTINGARDPIAFDSIASQVYQWKQGQPQNQAQASLSKPAPVSETPAAQILAPAPVIVPPTAPAPVVAPQTNTEAPTVVAEPVKMATPPPAVVISTRAAETNVPVPVTPIPAPVTITTAPPAAVVPVTEAPVVHTNTPEATVTTPVPAKPIAEVPAVSAKPQNETVEVPATPARPVVEPAKVETAPPSVVEKAPVVQPPVEQKPVETVSKAIEAVVQPEPKPVVPPVTRPRENVAGSATNRAVAAVVKAPVSPTNKIGTNLKTSPVRPAGKPVPALVRNTNWTIPIIGAAIVLLLAALGLVALVLKRSRKKRANSFISQSIEREFRP